MVYYIEIDEKKYKTPQKRWAPATVHKPSTVRPTLVGDIDVTYGSVNILEWKGEVEAPVQAPEGWGTISTLRESLYKRLAIAFKDHYEEEYTVHAIGPFPERSMTPDWAGASNVMYVSITLMTQESS